MITPPWYPDEKQLRQFAKVSLFGFGLLGSVARFGFGWETVAFVLWGVGVLTFIVGLLSPRAILPIYVALMAFALPIGWLISTLFLLIIFYGVMTPMAVIFRLIGRDPLSLKRPRAESYWRSRKQRSSRVSYYRQA